MENRTNTSNLTVASATQAYGIVLYCERFEACVAFYRDIVGLPVWFEKQGLCCFRFGQSYLMIEEGGISRDTRKQRSENPAMLRFNVSDVSAAAKLLEAKGILLDRKTFSWGEVATFADPDGNSCELKDHGGMFLTG